MNGAQGSNMLIAAVAGVPHQNGHFPLTLPIVRHRIERRVHPRREVQQFARTFGCVLAKSSNRRGWQIHSRLAFAPGDVVGKKAYISSHWKAHTGLPPRYARKTGAGLNATTQQSQPQCGIELTVEEKTLLMVSFCFRDDRFRQPFFPREKLHRKRLDSLSLKPSWPITHKLARARSSRPARH